MKERYSTVTREGQVTIPAEFRRELGLREGDRVALVVKDNSIRIVRRRSFVEETAGIFRSDAPPLSPRELRELAEQAFVDEAAERSAR
jgi:AbrB family looped-hinge helix DNA binding protein